jgi:hypothetical protein
MTYTCHIELDPELVETLSNLRLPPQYSVVRAPPALQFKRDQAGTLSDFLFAVRFACRDLLTHQEISQMRVLNTGHAAAHSMTRKERNVRKVLIKIAQQLDRLPSSLILRGVQLYSRESVRCGGYADVFQGKLASAEVAVKRFRLHDRGAEGPMRKVSKLLPV